ncbi:MAG: SDR family NAD(P)-dependent oxidoreductase [Actinomycetota bacterium]|nr:SDR family NAD(P)-dependent oxidoreductase [Actinomycetota bacterium]
MSMDPGGVTSRLFDVRGRRAVVTGAASGLGLAAAEVLAECGARVTLADIDAERGSPSRPAGWLLAAATSARQLST